MMFYFYAIELSIQNDASVTRRENALREFAKLKAAILEAPVDVVVDDTPESKFGGIIAGHVPGKLIGHAVALIDLDVDRLVIDGVSPATGEQLVMSASSEDSKP